MNKVKSYIKQFAATLVGDNDTAKAEKSFRVVDSALKSSIATLNGETITFEDAVSDAKEAQINTRMNNGVVLTSDGRTAFVENLLRAKNKVTAAEDALEKHKAKIAFLQGELDAFSVEVESN